MKYNEFYLLLFPCIFIANYIYNAVMAAFMSTADGYISADNRRIYSKHMFSPCGVLGRIMFLRTYPLVCKWLVIGQTINFAFGIFYTTVCLFAFSFAVSHSVTFVTVHFVVILIVNLIVSAEHLVILSKSGKL